ncbi:MAG: RluA family pseudouridine synthase [Alphaproteobacteria bacterium]|nr:RluA family pseudouridine synthase [Alphaproteobacteria bacterium]
MVIDGKLSGRGKASDASVVTDDEAGLRLDRWFRRHFPALSHGSLEKMLRTGQIRIDGKRAKASARLEAGQVLRVPPSLKPVSPAGAAAKAKTRPIRDASWLRGLVLYEDDDVVAINKPAGLAVQGGTGLKENLDDALMVFSKDGKTKPKLVHRLDRETSGVLLVARTDFAAAKLTAAFRHRTTEKIYWAVTAGVPEPAEGRIDFALLKRGERMAAVKEGEDDEAKTAATLYQVMESAAGKAAFVALWPLTGRTHQLRVHMACLGTPVLGDRLYGGENIPGLPQKEIGAGLHLHARRLVLPHPRKGVIDVTAPLSKDMRKTFRWFGFDEKAEASFDGHG